MQNLKLTVVNRCELIYSLYFILMHVFYSVWASAILHLYQNERCFSETCLVIQAYINRSLKFTVVVHVCLGLVRVSVWQAHQCCEVIVLQLK